MTETKPIDAGTWCDAHWSKFKDNKVRGTAGSMLLLMRVSQDPAFRTLCSITDSFYDEIVPAMINEKLGQIGFLCCYMGDDVMAEILEDANKVVIMRKAYKPEIQN